jgi:hypothetical protein
VLEDLLSSVEVKFLFLQNQFALGRGDRQMLAVGDRFFILSYYS